MAKPAEAKGQAKAETQINATPVVSLQQFCLHTLSLPAPFCIPKQVVESFYPLQESDGAQGVWKITFFTPEPVPMVLKEAIQAGYTAMTTTSRMVMRSPYDTAETYSEEVSDAPACALYLPSLEWHSTPCVGCWTPNGGIKSERLLQGTGRFAHRELGSCLSHWWVSRNVGGIDWVL